MTSGVFVVTCPDSSTIDALSFTAYPLGKVLHSFYVILGMLDSSSYSSICWQRRNCQILNIQRSSVEHCEPEWLYPTALRSIEKPI